MKSLSSSVSTLKDYARYRILDEAFKRALSTSPDFFILVFDKAALKIVSSILKMFDLLTGKISTIEMLDLPRKRFPANDAIYFITPSRDSIKSLFADFEDVKKTQYRSVHLLFTESVTDETMKEIAKCKNLAQRIKSFVETNLNFYIADQDVFTFGATVPNLQIFRREDNAAALARNAERLMTVCGTLCEYPYIQYQSGSKLCQAMAEKLADSLKKMADKSKMKPHDPKGTLIILDRSFDISSPVMMDYSYEGMVFDLIAVSPKNIVNPTNPGTMVNDEKVIENKEPVPALTGKAAKYQEETKSEEKQKLMELTEADPFWRVNRQNHIADVMAQIGQETSKFSQLNREINKAASKKEANIDMLHDIIKTMPAQKDYFENVQNHSKLINYISTQITQRELLKLIPLQQDICAGVKDNGTDIDTKVIVTSVAQLGTTYKQLSETDIIRTFFLYLVNYEVPRRDVDQLLKIVKSEYGKDILKNISFLLTHKSAEECKKAQRRIPKLTADEYKLFTQVALKDREQLRYLPKIAKIILDASKKCLSQRNFPFLGEIPEDYDKKKAVKSGISVKKGLATAISEDKAKSYGSQPRVLVYVIGGLSHQELAWVRSLQLKGIIDCPVTLGSECIMSTGVFLDAVNKITAADAKEEDIPMDVK